jgi:LAS superfamily LD-carboxypeptidase LdcB
MTLPIRPVVRPTDLKNLTNGKLPTSLLTSIGHGGLLHHKAARAFRALESECLRRGLPLTWTNGGTYRSYAAQETLFRQRFTTTYLAGQPRRWWNGQWWYLRHGVAIAAVPGTSNHGWGLAVDTAFDRNPADGISPKDATYIANHKLFPWFRDNIHHWGFSFELQSEPWHIRYVAGDTLPPAVLAYEASLVRPPAPNPPTPAPPIPAPGLPVFDPAKGQWGLWPIARKPVTRRGDRGDHVRYLQGVLKLKGNQNITFIDGSFGPQTHAAVVNLQRFFGLSPDGIVGPATWRLVDMLATK